MTACFELVSGSHNKFWTVQTIGSHYFATFGRIGTRGQTQVKDLGSAWKAEEYADKMILSKMVKGYKKVGSTDHPGAPADLLSVAGQGKRDSSVLGKKEEDQPRRRMIDL